MAKESIWMHKVRQLTNNTFGDEQFEQGFYDG